MGKDSSRPLRTYFFRPDRTNRSRVIADPGEPVWGHWKGLAAPSPRRTGPGSLERARRVLYARIFFVQIGPIGAKVQRRKTLYLTIFFSETVAPRRTCPGSLERARRALYAHIFFVQIGPIGADTYENLTGVIGKDSSRPLRTYFFFPDWTNRSRVITKNLNGVIGKDPSRPLRPYFFLPDRTNRSRVITHPGEPVWGHWKGLVGPCTHIFFSSRSDQQEPSYNGLKGTKEKNIWHLGEPDRGHGKGLVAPSTHIFFSTQENRSGVIGKGSPRPVRTYFFRPDRTNRGRVITHLEEPERGHWKGLVAPCTHIFFCPDRTNRSRVITRLGEPNRGHWKGPDASSTPIGPIGAKVQRRKTLYLTIFFSETVAPRRTCPGSLERARRALYAHIFFVQIGPIGAETEENRSGVIGTGSPRPVRTYFFRPDRTNRGRVITEPSYNGLKVTKEKKHFSLTIFFSETIAPRRTGLGSLERARRALYAHIFFVQIGPIGAKTQENRSGVIGKDSSRPLRPYFFLPDWTNRSRVITKNLNGVIGKDSSRPLRPYFFLPDRTNRSRVITHPGEPVWGHWKGLVGPCTPIFFSSRSDQQEPSYNGLKGTKEKNIIGPIGAETQENRSGVIGKGSPRPVRTYFFRPDRTNRGRVITHLEEPERGHWKGLVAPSTPIFFSTQENRSGVIGKDSSRPLRPYFFLPDWTNRSRVITKNLNGVIGKDSSRPLRPYFFLPDRTNRSRVITHPGEPVWGHWKGLVGPCTHIFFSSRSDQQEPSYNGLKGTKEKNIHPGEPDRGRWKGLVAPSTTQENRSGVIGKGSPRPVRTYFFRPDRTNRGRVITHPGEPMCGHWKGLVAPCTHIFFCPDRTNRSRVITHPGEPDRGRWKGLVAPSTPIFFSSRSDQ
ncbi:hypothetical protein V1477_017833 [Vespula maculifrons]|uniref:Ribosomal protein S3 n=1 Tax=Vespula maculifrons TaxID=7453 RepID=A0ABD2AZH7_VESMC